jgi:hypothetical protein
VRTWILFLTAWLWITLFEVVYIYLTSPIPGSQEMTGMAEPAWFINEYFFFIRLLGWLVIVFPIFRIMKAHKRLAKGLAIALMVLYGFVYYQMNFPFAADNMFYEPENLVMSSVQDNKVSKDRVVLGVEINGDARAYPVELIGYHHKLHDSVGGQPVLITYCIVCRTGRAFDPVVAGKQEEFRVVGMTEYNAMFEDATSKSWWMQATGEAVAGPLKGQFLKEIFSEQLALSTWARKYPHTKVMQPDSAFIESYGRLEGFDRGWMQESRLLFTDSSAWENKSWVVGVVVGDESKAFDWIQLRDQRFMQSELGETPLLVWLESDTISFHVWDRSIDGVGLTFAIDDSSGLLTDKLTGSLWNNEGRCISGSLQGSRLKPIQAYQEYWHSWKSFHPKTTKHE